MHKGPAIAAIASLIGDPARASMLSALMGGHELTASELAREGGVTASTASGHLARLLDGGLVLAAQRGRHRYYRLASPAIADLIETLMSLAGPAGPRRVRPGPSDEALRRARICYDHLAGEEGLRLADGMVASAGWRPRTKPSRSSRWAAPRSRRAASICRVFWRPAEPCAGPVWTGASAGRISAARSARRCCAISSRNGGCGVRRDRARWRSRRSDGRDCAPFSTARP